MQSSRVLKYSALVALAAASATLLAAVASNTAPVITSKPYPVAEVGQAYKYATQAIDAEGNTITYSVEQGPGGMKWSVEDKATTWTPTAAQQGTQQVTVRARDNWGASTDQQFTLHTVADFCEIYPITLPQSLVANASNGQMLSNIPRGTGAGNYSWLTWTGAVDASTLAASLTAPGDSYNYANPDNAGDHQLDVLDWAQGASGSMNSSNVREKMDALKTRDIIIPTWSTVRGSGSHFDYRVEKFAAVRLKAYDLTGQGWLSFEFRGFRNCYNDAPIAPAQTVATSEDQSVAFTLAASDPDGDALAYQILQQPTHGQLLGSGAALTYVPDANYFGADSFTYVARDAELSSSVATLSIEVGPVNDPPVASGQHLQTNEDVALPLQLSALDVDDANLAYSISTAPVHGTLSGSGGALVYVPDANYHGPDQFTFVASDGRASSSATISIDVIESNDAPVARNLDYVGAAGQPMNILLVGFDPDGDALSYRLLSNPAHGSLTGTAPSLSFTPDAAFSGAVNFTYLVSDGRLNSVAATVSIQVTGANHPPKLGTLAPAFLDERTLYAYPAHAVDPDIDDVLSYQLERNVPGASIDRTSGKLSWSPQGGLVGGARELNKACRKPATDGAMDPMLQWSWNGSSTYPVHDQVVSIPLVGQLTDDNGDGKVDQADDTDVVAITHKRRDEYGYDPYLRSSVIRILDGKSGRELRTIVPDPMPEGFSSLALADIDGDGDVEILVPTEGGLQVLRNDGSVLWRRDDLAQGADHWGLVVTISDLDADGKPEIIVGSYVLDDHGNTEWRLSATIGSPIAQHAGTVSVVDIDGDGKQEVIAGPTAYRHDGSVLWSAYDGTEAVALRDGLTGAGDVDKSSAGAEIVVVSYGHVFLLSAQGRILWRQDIPNGGYGGPPTLADMDGDGELEIGVAGRASYTVFNADGSVLWSRPTQDYTSSITGSTAFDLDGDGETEVLYNDENYLRIYRGRDGAVLFEALSTTGTHKEYPVVANIDDDAAAEILVGTNEFWNYYYGTSLPATHGLQVFESATKSWMPTRRLWNQHDYHIDNINDDGSVPAHPQPSWQTHNTWRLNGFLDRDPAGMADLALFDLQLDPGVPGSVRVLAKNRGLAPSATTTLVRIYNGSSASGKLLGTIKLPSLASGEERSLRLDNVDLGALGDNLYASIDEVDTVVECVQNNNSVRATVFRVRASDQGGLYDRQVFTVGVRDVNEAPVFQATTLPVPHINQKFRASVKAVDPDLGDAVTYRLEYAPMGMSIDAASGKLRWTPFANQAGVVAFTVRATDMRGASVAQDFSMTLAANRAPTIDSTPLRAAMAGQDYRYDVQASDPDGDPLSYVLVGAPAGMSVDSGNGLIRWSPTLAQAGDVDVTVRVLDPNGGAVTQSWTLAVAMPANHLPVFTSSADTAVVLGQRYEYDADAVDPDGDVLQYSLLEGPAGMTVDTVTGLIVWQARADQIGVHPVRLQVVDPRGGNATQDFEVIVSGGVDGGNHPPSIDSVPETFALIGTAYRYDANASDLDGDTLSYALSVAPSGMTIDASTGVIGWAPTTAQAGLNNVVIEVSDGRGGKTTQGFGVLASTVITGGSSGGGNHPPAFSSDPLTLVTLGQAYRYYPSASDADGDALSYELVQAPPGMSINATSGVIAWTPPALGAVTVAICVNDGRGGSATQTFTVTTVASELEIDHRPVVTQAPSGSAVVGLPYTMPLQAVDADGDPMQYALVTGPVGASVDADGVVHWMPASQGSFGFTVRISSGEGYTDVSWTVVVASAEAPLSVHVVANPERVAPGAPYVASLEYAGASGPVALQANLEGSPLTLDSDGATTLVAPATPGYYHLNVRIDDGQRSATDSADLFVADPNDVTAPTVSIASPTTDARVTAPTPVFGEVDGDDVARWTLSLLDKSTGAMTPIATGNSAVGAGVLGKLDPTLLSNGFYTLVLQAWDASGNQAQDSRSVLVDGEMKLGHFSLSFEDVSIPMAGVPIRVTRTYDTRRRNERLDFGNGWSVDYQNLRLTESRAPGYSWTVQQERNGFFGNWCVRPNGDPIVAVTAPDGKLLKFRAKAMPECQFAAPQPDVQIVFEPLPGTDAQLDQTDYGIVRLTQVAGSGVYSLLDPGDTEQSPANPSHYRLKLPDGTVYSITQGVGLTQVSEPDGNTLTYNSSGIHHSRGQDVTFLRDGLGRIEQVVLPDGRRRRYTYTPAGDLEIAVDAGMDLTSFAYLPQAPHYLRDIIDPRGVRVSRNEYDDDGRLVATIDADGHRIEYTHNLDGRVETIKDRRGFASTYVYDIEGRVTAESNALGETTLHKYDANGNELETTDPLNHVTTRSFDARGNLLTETNPLHEKVTRTYDEHNNLLTQTDALGRVVAKNAYHAYNGKLVMTQDALGNLTSFGYDSGLGTGGTGELTGMVDAENGVTRYEMNFFGHRAREFDAMGNRTDYNVDLVGRVLGESRRRTRADGSLEYLSTQFTLDDKDRVTATVHPDGSRTTVEYDGNGKPVKSCDGLSRCTLQSYNARGELERTTYPDSTYEESLYDENGNVSSRRDRGGRVTKMVYDKANRLIETILPDETPGTDADNPRTSSEYDTAGRMVASVDELGHRTTYGYDDAGRRIWVKDALGHATSTDYDAAGQRIAVTDALGHTTRFEYDLAGRLVTTIHPDGTPASLTDNPRTRTEYDAVGRKLAEIDELGRRKEFGYDPLGRLVSVTLPNPKTSVIDEGALVTRYGYDEAGNKLSQTDALGRVTRWEYDPMGRQLKRILPLGQSESMAYDAAGQMKSRTDFNGVTTHYSYDDGGRLAGTDYAHDADVITTYTDSGQRESVTDGQGITLYTYDARDRLARVQYPDGNAITYGYDAAGNRTALHSPAQDQSFEFDELNRLWKVRTRVLGGAERTAVYGYDDVGNRTSLVQADGTSTVTVFDERNRLRQLTTRNAGGALLFGATYDVDLTGARTGAAESDASGPTRSVGYAYDSVKRLRAEVITRSGQADRVTGYEYDAVGNRLKKTEAGVATYYLVDDNDRLQKEIVDGVTTMNTYDDNGNTTGNARSGETTTYTFDDANRLVRTQNSAGLDAVTGYDADGIRNREMVGDHLRVWLIDANRDFAQTVEVYADNQLAVTWTYGDGLLAQNNVGSNTLRERNLHADGMGSVRLATDRAGQATNVFEYDAFGAELSQTKSNEIDHRYRSEQIDLNTGLYNLRARWYDTSTGRFTSMDPLAENPLEPGSLQRYNYTHSEPVNHADPAGAAQLADVMVAPTMQVNLSASLSVTTLDTAVVAANDAFWMSAGAGTSASTSTSLITALALTAAANEADRFLGVPIIVFGQEFPEHALHIGEAQMGQGSNFRPISPALNRFPEWGDRTWLRRTSECGDESKARFGIGRACDEYPFAKSRQGGPVNYVMWGVSLQFVDLAESRLSGSFINQFYSIGSGAAISPDGFSKQSRFLVLGIPGARSFYTDRLGRVHYWR